VGADGEDAPDVAEVPADGVDPSGAGPEVALAQPGTGKIGRAVAVEAPPVAADNPPLRARSPAVTVIWQSHRTGRWGI
jgi:hypothetical protein